MALDFTPLHPCFVAHASPIALREVFDTVPIVASRGG